MSCEISNHNNGAFIDSLAQMADEPVIVDIIPDLRAMLDNTNQIQRVLQRMSATLAHQESLFHELGAQLKQFSISSLKSEVDFAGDGVWLSEENTTVLPSAPITALTSTSMLLVESLFIFATPNYRLLRFIDGEDVHAYKWVNHFLQTHTNHRDVFARDFPNSDFGLEQATCMLDLTPVTSDSIVDLGAFNPLDLHHSGFEFQFDRPQSGVVESPLTCLPPILKLPLAVVMKLDPFSETSTRIEQQMRGMASGFLSDSILVSNPYISRSTLLFFASTDHDIRGCVPIFLPDKPEPPDPSCFSRSIWSRHFHQVSHPIFALLTIGTFFLDKPFFPLVVDQYDYVGAPILVPYPSFLDFTSSVAFVLVQFHHCFVHASSTKHANAGYNSSFNSTLHDTDWPFKPLTLLLEPINVVMAPIMQNSKPPMWVSWTICLAVVTQPPKHTFVRAVHGVHKNNINQIRDARLSSKGGTTNMLPSNDVTVLIYTVAFSTLIIANSSVITNLNLGMVSPLVYPLFAWNPGIILSTNCITTGDLSTADAVVEEASNRYHKLDSNAIQLCHERRLTCFPGDGSDPRYVTVVASCARSIKWADEVFHHSLRMVVRLSSTKPALPDPYVALILVPILDLKEPTMTDGKFKTLFSVTQPQSLCSELTICLLHGPTTTIIITVVCIIHCSIGSFVQHIVDSRLKFEVHLQDTLTNKELKILHQTSADEAFDDCLISSSEANSWVLTRHALTLISTGVILTETHSTPEQLHLFSRICNNSSKHIPNFSVYISDFVADLVYFLKTYFGLAHSSGNTLSFAHMNPVSDFFMNPKIISFAALHGRQPPNLIHYIKFLLLLITKLPPVPKARETRVLFISKYVKEVKRQPLLQAEVRFPCSTISPVEGLMHGNQLIQVTLFSAIYGHKPLERVYGIREYPSTLVTPTSVHWIRLPHVAFTRDDLTGLFTSFTIYHLEDKVVLDEGSIVMNLVMGLDKSNQQIWFKWPICEVRFFIYAQEFRDRIMNEDCKLWLGFSFPSHAL